MSLDRFLIVLALAFVAAVAVNGRNQYNRTCYGMTEGAAALCSIALQAGDSEAEARAFGLSRNG